MSTQSIVIHTTPPLHPLPACDIESIYYITLFQLASPGRWKCQTGDWGSNGGELPYITHLNHLIQPQHLSSLPGFSDPDDRLDETQRAEAACWVAYIQGRVTDLVHHSLYSLPLNYAATLAKTHSSSVSFPRSQYVPQRLRGMYKARLQHVGLWGLGGTNEGDLAAEDQKRLEELYVHAPGGTVAPRAWNGWRSGREFEQRRRKIEEEELRNLIREALGPLDRLLADKPYFFGSRPSTPDLWLFANLTLVVSPHLPNPLFPALLRTEFPKLVEHHDRLLHLLFPSASSASRWSAVPRLPTPEPTSLWETLRSSLPSLSSSTSNPSEANTPGHREMSKSERAFRRGRWMWYAGAVGSMVAYLFASGLVRVEYRGKGGDSDGSDGLEVDDTVEEVEVEEVVVVPEPEAPVPASEIQSPGAGEPSAADLMRMAAEAAADVENPYDSRED